MCFGVKYDNPKHADNICMADWSHWGKRCWVRSWKDVEDCRWYKEEENDGALNQPAYEEILKKFRLKAFKAELPLEILELMSPAELMEFREKKDLPYLAVISDIPGDHEKQAEDYN